MTDPRTTGARTAVAPMPSPMTQRRLDWALRARGPALACWPDRERAAALALLVRSHRAREALGDALARDAGQTPHDPAALARMQTRLRRRLAARTAPAAAGAAGAIPGARWGALAACALAGVWLGLAAPAPDARPDFFAAAPDPFSAPLPPPSPVPDAEEL